MSLITHLGFLFQNIQRVFGLNQKYEALLADKGLKEQECSALKDAAQASEDKAAAIVAEKEELDRRMAAAGEELEKKDEEMAALTSLHKEAMRAKDEAHANTLRPGPMLMLLRWPASLPTMLGIFSKGMKLGKNLLP